MQETCLRAFRDIARFPYQSPGSFSAGFRRSPTTSSSIASATRTANAAPGRRFVSVRRTNPLGPEPADTQTPSRLFAQQEAVERLLDRLNALPEDYRKAILMAKIERLSTAEMAERLGKSREAVALLVYRAVKRFRELSDAR